MEEQVYLKNRRRIFEKSSIKSSLIFGMCAMYIFQFFLQDPALQICLAIVCTIVFFSSLLDAQLIPRLFGLGMFMFGVSLNIVKGNDLESISTDVTANLPLLSLFILVPLISIPMKMEGYFDSVKHFMKKMIGRPQRIFASISFVLFCLGPILNLGSIRLMHEMLDDLKIHPIILAKSYLVGFSTVVLWSPYIASVALVLFYLDIPIADYLPVGLAAAFIQLLIGNLLFKIWIKGHTYDEKDDLSFTESQKDHTHYRKILSLFVTLFFLLGLIFLLEAQTKWSMMFLVSLLAIIYPVTWCFVKNRLKEFGTHLKMYQTQTSSLLNNEIVLFLSAGLFGRALSGTSFADGIQTFLYYMADKSFLLFSIAIMATILTLTFIGVHQIVVVTVLLTQIDPASVGAEPVALALLLMTSWSMASVISPINPLNLLVSNSVKQPSLLVGFKWNGLYLLSTCVVGILYVYLIH